MRINSKIIFFIFLILEKLNCGGVEEIEIDSKYNNEDYLNAYKVPLSEMDISNNDEVTIQNTFNKAYDEDDQTCWLSDQNNTIHRFITISFSKSITINRLVYKSSFFSNKKGYGYPSELKIYYKFENSKDNYDFLLIDDIISDPTSNKVVFEFPEVTNKI